MGLSGTNDKHRSKSILRNNKLLLKALQDHTKEKIRWGVLNDWETAWADFIELFGGIRELTSSTIGEIAKARKVIFTRIEKEGGNQDAFKCIVDTIVEASRHDAIDDNFGPDERLVRIGVANNTSNHTVITRVGDKEIFRFTDRVLAEEVLEIFNLANTSLRVLIIMTKKSAIREAISKMQLAIEELDNMLNPVALYPILLRTRCDYCPV